MAKKRVRKPIPPMEPLPPMEKGEGSLQNTPCPTKRKKRPAPSRYPGKSGRI